VDPNGLQDATAVDHGKNAIGALLDTPSFRLEGSAKMNKFFDIELQIDTSDGVDLEASIPFVKGFKLDISLGKPVLENQAELNPELQIPIGGPFFESINSIGEYQIGAGRALGKNFKGEASFVIRVPKLIEAGTEAGEWFKGALSNLQSLFKPRIENPDDREYGSDETPPLITLPTNLD
jgi:hypothetical protein